MKSTTTTAVILSGRWRPIGRLVWFALFLLCATLLLYSLVIVPPVLGAILETYDGLATILASLSLMRRYILVIAYYATSILVFRQRSHELGPLLMACLYVGLGSVPLATGIFNLTHDVMEVPPSLNALALTVLSIGISLGILSVYVFPDGRFVPTPARWALVPILFIAIGYAIAFYLVGAIPLPFFWVLMGTLAVGVYTQVYRYRYQENPTQRQQVKWYVYGVVSFIIFQIIAAVTQAIIGPPDTLSDLLWNALAEFCFFVSYLLILVTNLIAIVRYRLYDINYVINRSILYTGLTVLLAGLFAGVFFGLQFLLNALVGGQQPVISAGLAGALVILIFQPTRRRLRHLVDRRLYGIELDYSNVGQQQPFTYGTNESETMSLFGRYQGMVLIGRGGMGDVYRTTHPTQKIPVAIKLLKETGEADAEARRRFRREAQTIARLRHPHIVTLYEIDEQEGALFMVMEYVDGKTISQLLRERGRLPLAETTAVLANIADALDYAHDQDVIHRDIKPSNILIEQGTDRAVLMDFGIAKIAAETQLTQTGGMVGTLDYISPEQIQGSPLVDRRADIYSLGVMAYQMLTGELPFKHNNPGAMVMAHLMQPPPNPRDILPDLSPEAAAALVKAMAKKPEQRFRTAGEFILNLQA